VFVVGVGQIHYNTPFFLPILEIILGGIVMDGLAKWRLSQVRRDADEESTNRKRKGEKVPTMEDRVRTSILDLRRIYADMSDEEYSQWYFKKYRVKADAVLKVLKGVSKDATE
jgi:hypothetical protein